MSAPFSFAKTAQAICDSIGITIEELKSKRRGPKYTRARQQLIAEALRHDWSYGQIGKHLDRKPSTIWRLERKPIEGMRVTKRDAIVPKLKVMVGGIQSGRSVEQLAKEHGLHRSQLSKLMREQKIPSVYQLRRVAKLAS
jgi:transposase-like protein